MTTSQKSFLQKVSLLFAPFFSCKHFGFSGDFFSRIPEGAPTKSVADYLDMYHKLFTIKALTSVKSVVVHHHPPGAIKPNMVQLPCEA